MKKEKKKINYCHYICILITLGFLTCSFFLFPHALGRIIEGFRDLGISIVYYFSTLFGLKSPLSPTVNEMPKMPFFDFLSNSPFPATSIPNNFDGFKTGWSAYWANWVSKDNFLAYLSFLGNLLYYFSYALLIIMPLILIFKIFFKRYMKNENNDYNIDSRPLKIYKFVTARTYYPVKKWLLGVLSFIKEHSIYRKLWLVIWLFNFNVFTIILEFIAFYFYFVVTFDLANIYQQIYKLFLDLSVPFQFIPIWAWIIIGIFLFDRFRKKIAYRRLNHMEMKNRGFINARPIVVMVCGTMGKKKTTTITDIALSQEVMFRDKAFEKILENDLKFPQFPWINLENEIKKAMEKHIVYNLATVKEFVKIERKNFELVLRKCLKRGIVPFHPRLFFGYDFKRYGLTYDDKLKVVDIWEIIEIYAQLYFIYIIQSSLLISNYSVRVDNILSDVGNFPMWNTEFFKRDSRLINAHSRHSHILDFDSLRLGKKVLKDNYKKDVFEFGVVVITEIGKERCNNLELNEVKRKTEETNQKNDLFNAWLKMIRHSATVDNFPFVKVITDEQRPSSWGADARDLCEIVHIKDSGETRLAMPFFSLGELLYSWLFGKFTNIYHNYRFTRGDNTLLMYLVKNISTKLHHNYIGIYNRFSYCALRVQIESGTMDGNFDEHNYFLMSKKIYSKRFSTDCFSEYFTDKSLRSRLGLNDLEEYSTAKATFEELKGQNSYFINDLINMEKSETK